jgi:hypothetical protein
MPENTPILYSDTSEVELLPDVRQHRLRHYHICLEVCVCVWGVLTKYAEEFALVETDMPIN